MRLGVFTIAIGFCLLGIPTIAPAQAFPLEPGARIRLTVPCDLISSPAAERRRIGCAFTGELVGWRTDTIDLAMNGTSNSYTLTTVRQLEVSRGYQSHWLLGSAAGFVVGAGSTFLVLYHGRSTSLCNRSANQDALRSGECLGLVSLGGLAGAGLGALIGSRIRTERWQRMPYERLRISLAPRGRVMLELAMAF